MAGLSGQKQIIGEEAYVMLAMLIESMGVVRIDRGSVRQALRDLAKERPVFVVEPSWSGEGMIIKLGRPERPNEDSSERRVKPLVEEAPKSIQFSSTDREIAKQLGWEL